MKSARGLLALICISITNVFLLTSCGGSGSGSTTAPANTTITLSVSNRTAVDFAEMSIEDGFTGNSIYSSSFRCASQASDCVYFYTGPALKAPVVLIFKDKHGHIAAAYDTPVTPSNYLPASVSLWTTGAYLIEALKTRNQFIASLNQGDLETRLEFFTKNYTDQVTEVNNQSYVEVARYFVNKLQSSSPSVNEFLDALALRLVNQESASASEFTIAANHINPLDFSYALNRFMRRINSVELISSAHAQNTDCSDSTLAFLTIGGSVAGGVTNSFPIAGTVASTAFALGMNSCTNIVSKLNEIMSQLTNLQNSLDNLQNNLGKLTNFIATTALNTNIQTFTDVSKDLVQLSSNHQVILTNNNVTSLIEYVKKRGGSGDDALRIALEKDGPGSVFQDLLSRISSTSSQNYQSQIERLTDTQFDTLLNALNLLCKEPGPGSSVINQRVQCNLVIATTTAKLIASQSMAYQLAGATYDLLAAYPSEASRFGYNINISAAQQKATLLAKLQNQREALVSTYRNTIKNSNGIGGYFNTFDGLPSGLLNNMANVGCYNEKLPRSANIVAWVKDGSDEYLETLCPSNGFPTLTRYYIKYAGVDVADRDNVSNVLGVLVRSSMLDPRGDYRRRLPQIRYIAMRHAPGNAYRGEFAFNSEDLRLASPKIISDNNLGPENRLTRLYDGYSNAILNSPNLSLFFKWTFPNKGENIIFRFTDINGYSYAYVLNKDVNRNSELLCVMVECTNLSGGGVTFKNGPQDLSLKKSQPDKEDVYGVFGWTLGGKFIDSK